MTAVACLRVTVDRAPAGVTPAALVSLVAKLGSARLEAGWAWPRSHKVVSPFTFVLADPRVDQLDASELTTLAADLRRSLFGSEADGEVALMLFEGDPVEVARIAAATDESLEGILAGTEKPAFPGRIIRITPAGAVEIPADSAAAHLAQANFAAEGADTTEEEAEEPPPAAPDPGATASPEIGFWGVYFLVRERFIGSAVDWGPVRSGGSAAYDPRAHERDLEILALVGGEQSRPEDGYLFAPMDFSTLLRKTIRDDYQAELLRLFATHRLKPAANIYNVPRSPLYGAFAELKSRFHSYFSLVNLLVEDPDFEVASLPVGAAGLVTLVLTGRTEAENLAALARFDTHATAYRARKVWQGATRIRTPRELALCLRLKMPFLSGPAVAPLTRRPAGQVIWAAKDLPYRGWRGDEECGG